MKLTGKVGMLRKKEIKKVKNKTKLRKPLHLKGKNYKYRHFTWNQIWEVSLHPQESTMKCWKILEQLIFVLGSRGCAPEPGRGVDGGGHLPELHEDQHLLMGQDQETILQTEKVSHQVSSWRLRKLFWLNIYFWLF